MCCLDARPDRLEHRFVPDHAQVDQVAGVVVGIAGDVGRAVFVADRRSAFRPQPVNIAADPFQPPGHEGLAALRQGGVDLLEQVVRIFACWHVTQDDLPIWCFDHRQAARPIDLALQKYYFRHATSRI